MNMVNEITRISLQLIILVLFLPSMLEASEVQENLALWREHILTKGNIGGIEYDSDYYRALVKMGPNCLPEVFSAYRKESDTHVLYYYQGLIGRIAHFDFFMYSEEPLEKNGYPLQCTKDIPFLSMQVGKNGLSVLPHPLYITVQRDKIVQWWDQRASFLQRDKIINNIRAITGKTREEILRYDKIKAREYFKLSVYGIYNIPYFIDIIDRDNNPVIFCEFLRISNHPEYQALQMRSDVVSNTWKADSKYPTRESKIKMICEWWSETSKTFTGLNGLYSEIEGRVQNLCNR